MLLAIDIGNTNVTLGVWNGTQWKHVWRLRTQSDRTIDEYGISLMSLLRDAGLSGAIQHVILGSVVPKLTLTIEAVSERYMNITAVRTTHALPLPISIQTDNPAEVGADRIANAVAATKLYQAPSIIIDMGTATTFDVVSNKAELLGVVIAPGLRVSADALTKGAAQLSQVDLEAPKHVLGKNTIHAIQSGLVYGYLGLVEGMVNRLRQEHPDPSDTVRVIGTGGLISLLTPYTDIFDEICPSLTLDGLRFIYEASQI